MSSFIRPAVALALTAAWVTLSACSAAPTTAGDRARLHSRVQETLSRFKEKDPGMVKFLEAAHGYAVFPTVAKGGIGFGGAYGRGEVFEGGQMIGYCDLSQGTIGFQLGGQAYSELILFSHEGALKEFIGGDFAFAGQASAVAATVGASADADYQGGVMVFTIAKGGLMFEASIGGQKFDYIPKKAYD